MMKKQANLLFLFFLGFSGQASSMEKPITKMVTLGNGLNVIVREDHRAPVVVSQVWYRVGASDEVRGITGISHALEHMMFQGTPTLPKDGFAKLISKLGGENNAFTGDDFTAYYEELSATHLEAGLIAEADRMQNLVLDKAVFENEKQVILEERRMRTDDNPQGVVYERFMSSANPIGPYHDPVIGWQEDIENLTVDDLKKWYQKWYSPNNATLVIVGDVKADDAIAMVRTHFEKIPSRAMTLSPRRGELRALGEKRMRIQIPAQLPYIMMGYDVPTLKSTKTHEDIFALVLIDAIMDLGQSARLNRDLVKKDRVAAKAGTYYDPFKKYAHQFLITATPSQEVDIPQLETKIQDELKKLKEAIVDEAELEKAKNQIVAQHLFERDSVSEQATMMGLLETVGLSWELIDSFPEEIKKVTPAQIQAAAQKYFTQQSLTVAELVPLTNTEEG